MGRRFHQPATVSEHMDVYGRETPRTDRDCHVRQRRGRARERPFRDVGISGPNSGGTLPKFSRGILVCTTEARNRVRQFLPSHE